VLPSPADQLTVIIPAYNEEASVADTVRSVLTQTTPPARVIVVDDRSTDRTGELARAAGAEVICPPENTGSKAGAQNLALERVDTPYCMAIDADTTLAPDAIELLLAPLVADPRVAATCGFVVPRHVDTVWERGRYVEYLLSFTFYKPTQDYFGKPLISSGCFSAYRTDLLRDAGGWSERTRAEDMDLTWSFHRAGHRVRFVPEAVCYPIEPHDLDFMGKQLRRWSHGFVQNVRLHWTGILRLPFLSTVVGVAMFDAVVASLIYLVLLPLLVVVLGAPLLLVYVIDVPAVLVPVVVAARRRGELVKALVSLPSFFLLRTVNGFFMLEALWTEVVLRRPLLVYEKGH
jgi:biofilm PGA synthesis N-glycosyltransferase PgaC